MMAIDRHLISPRDRENYCPQGIQPFSSLRQQQPPTPTVPITEPVKFGFRLLFLKLAKRIEKKVKITQYENCLDLYDRRDYVQEVKCKN